MKNKIIGLVMVMMLAAGTAFAADTEVVDIYVTPGAVAANISVNPASYDFGTVDLSVSSGSQTGVAITNEGVVGLTLAKAITNDALGGTCESVAAAPSLANEFFLRCIENGATQPADSAFTVNCSTFRVSGGNGNGANPLVNLAGANVSLGLDGHCTTWYKIDMPGSVDTFDSRQIRLTFTATAQ